MQTYDLNLLLSPNLSAEQVATEKAYIETTLNGAGAELVNLDEPGNRRLAYAIGKDREAYFLYYRVRANGNPETSVASLLRLRDNVRRVLMVRDRPEWKTKKA